MCEYDEAEVNELGTLALGRQLHQELYYTPVWMNCVFEEADRQYAKDMAVTW
jgi:hypothetical protein